MTDWEQVMVQAENMVIWLVAPWLALWRTWQHRG